jgi:hypothetical protein
MSGLRSPLQAVAVLSLWCVSLIKPVVRVQPVFQLEVVLGRAGDAVMRPD